MTEIRTILNKGIITSLKNSGPESRSLALIQQALQADTPPEEIRWKPQEFREYPEGSGKWTALAFAHVDARFVQNRLDEALGPFGWQTVVKVEAGLLMVGISIKPSGIDEWIVKWDTGQDDPQRVSGGIGGGRGLFSQSFKRAGYQWGIARDLYDLPTPRCKVEVYRTRGGGVALSSWVDDPWGMAESPETGRTHKSRVDQVQDVIKPSATAFYDIAYSRLKYEREQASEIVEKYLDANTGLTNWDRAIKALEMELPPTERYYTAQVKRQKEQANAQVN